MEWVWRVSKVRLVRGFSGDGERETEVLELGETDLALLSVAVQVIEATRSVIVSPSQLVCGFASSVFVVLIVQPGTGSVETQAKPTENLISSLVETRWRAHWELAR